MFFSREYSQMDVEKLKFSILTPDVLNLCRIFEERGFEIRIVGGAVRDMLMEVSTLVCLKLNCLPPKLNFGNFWTQNLNLKLVFMIKKMIESLW